MSPKSQISNSATPFHCILESGGSLTTLNQRFFTELTIVMHHSKTNSCSLVRMHQRRLRMISKLKNLLPFGIKWGRYESCLWGRDEGQDSLLHLKRSDAKLRKATPGIEHGIMVLNLVLDLLIYLLIRKESSLLDQNLPVEGLRGEVPLKTSADILIPIRPKAPAAHTPIPPQGCTARFTP